jgi:hypothetical protein
MFAAKKSFRNLIATNIMHHFAVLPEKQVWQCAKSLV